MNNSIIKWFKILLKWMKIKLLDMNDEDKISQSYRIQSISNSLNVIKNLDFEIDSIEKIKNISGLGRGTLRRIDEILKTNRLSEVVWEDIKQSNTENLTKIFGVGYKVAKKFISMGIYNYNDLKSAIFNGFKVSSTIKKGVKYHNLVSHNVSRESIKKTFNSIKNKTKDLHDKYKYKIECCGSYRRKKETSNDIDILIGCRKGKEVLEQFINILKDDVIVCSFTEKTKTKFMGLAVIKNTNRLIRIDVRVVGLSEWYVALLYFTGSKTFNQMMRKTAKDKGMRLNEYMLKDLTNNKIYKFKTEKDIFKKLDVKYVKPEYR